MKHLCLLLAIGWLSLGQGLQAQRLPRQYTFGYNQVFPFDMIGRNHVVWASYKHYLKEGFFVGLRADYQMEEGRFVGTPIQAGGHRLGDTFYNEFFVITPDSEFALEEVVSSYDDLEAGFRQFETRDQLNVDIYLNLTAGYTFSFWQDRLDLSVFGGVGATYRYIRMQSIGIIGTIQHPDISSEPGIFLFEAYRRSWNFSPLAGFEFAYRTGPWLLGLNAVFNPQATTIITHGLLLGRQF